jgi:hypothetical protein
MSSKPIIAVTRVLPDAGMALLAEATDIEVRVFNEIREARTDKFASFFPSSPQTSAESSPVLECSKRIRALGRNRPP